MTLEQLSEHVKAYHEATGGAVFLMTEDEGRMMLAVVGNLQKLQMMAMGAAKSDEENMENLGAIFGPVVMMGMTAKKVEPNKSSGGFNIQN